MSITTLKARKILGDLGKPLSDEEIKAEVEFATFLAELVLKQYEEKKVELGKDLKDNSNND